MLIVDVPVLCSQNKSRENHVRLLVFISRRSERILEGIKNDNENRITMGASDMEHKNEIDAQSKDTAMIRK